MKNLLTALFLVSSITLFSNQQNPVESTIQMSGFIGGGLEVSIQNGDIQFGELRQYQTWESSKKIVGISVVDRTIPAEVTSPIKLTILNRENIFLKKNGTSDLANEKIKITPSFEGSEYIGAESFGYNGEAVVSNTPRVYNVYVAIPGEELRKVRGEYEPKAFGQYSGSFTVRTEYLY